MSSKHSKHSKPTEQQDEREKEKETENEKLYQFPDEAQEEELPKPTDEETEMFKQQVSEWLKLDDQVRKLNVAVRERRTHQRVLSSKVQEFMIKYKYDNLNTTQGVIKSNVREVKQPLKIGDVRIKLDEVFTDVVGGSSPTDVATFVKFKEMIENIFEGERPTVVKQSLHRRIPKVSMSLDL